MSNDRIRRPPLDRTKPVRNPSTLLGRGNRDASGNGVPDADVSATSDGKVSDGLPPPPSPQDVIAQSVNLGYSVIDDYIKRGQRAADGLRRGTYGTDALAEDLQDIGARMVQYLADFTATWAEFMDRAGASGMQTPPWPMNGLQRDMGQAARSEGTRVAPAATAEPATGSDHPSPGRGTPGAELRVRVDVHTRRRAQISLDLKPVPAGCSLIVHTLRASPSGGPRIEQVSFEPGAADTGTIRVIIPDDLPAGTYSGLVVDAESNRPVGVLMVALEVE
jgi:hypothetical protein